MLQKEEGYVQSEQTSGIVYLIYSKIFNMSLSYIIIYKC